MDIQEFRSNFEFLYQSATQMAPDINSYEISLCLTKAVDKLILESIESVDTNERSRRLLHPLIQTRACDTQVVKSEYSKFKKYKVYFPDSLQYNLRYAISSYSCPSFLVSSTQRIDNLNEVFKNPFRQPNNRKAILATGGEDDRGRFDYIYLSNKVSMSDIEITYVRYNNPIIVENFRDDEDLIGNETIKGLRSKTSTELTEEFHNAIVDVAVVIAKQTLKY